MPWVVLWSGASTGAGSASKLLQVIARVHFPVVARTKVCVVLLDVAQGSFLSSGHCSCHTLSPSQQSRTSHRSNPSCLSASYVPPMTPREAPNITFSVMSSTPHASASCLMVNCATWRHLTMGVRTIVFTVLEMVQVWTPTGQTVLGATLGSLQHTGGE